MIEPVLEFAIFFALLAPVIIGGVLGAAGVITTVSLLGSTALGGAVLFGGLAAVQLLIARVFGERPKLGALGGAAERTIRAEAVPARWWFGRGRANGMLVHIAEEEASDDAIWLVYALAEAPIEAVHGVWIDAEYVPLVAVPGKMARPASTSDAPQKNWLWVHPVLDGSASPSRLAFDHGATDRTIDPAAEGLRYADLVAEAERLRLQREAAANGIDIPGWGSTKGLRGIAHVIVRLEQPDYSDLDDRVWAQVPELTWDITGQRYATAPGTTEQARSNAADVWYWWLKNRRGLTDAQIDQASYIDARAVCNEFVTASLPAGYEAYPATGRRYAVAGLITADDEPEAVEEELNFAWAGHAVDFDGVVHMRPGAPRASVATIGPDDIVQLGAVTPQPPLGERLNRASMELTQSARHDFRRVRLPAISDEVAIARDGVTIERDLGARAFVPEPVAALRLLKIALRRARAGLQAELVVMPGTDFGRLRIMPADIVTLDLPEFGLSGLECQVLAARVEPDWSVRLTLEEWPSGVFDAVGDLPPIRPVVAHIPTPTDAPPAPTVTREETHAAVQLDGTIRSQALVAWRPRGYAADLFLARSDWSTELAVPAQRGVAEVDLPGPGAYSGWVRAVNRAGIRSAPTPVALGLTWASLVPPVPTVESVSVLSGAVLVTLAAVPDRDVAGVEVRYTAGAVGSTDPLPVITAADWDDADRINVAAVVAAVRGQPIYASFLVPSSGRFRFFARYITRAGLEGPVGEVGEFLLVVPVRSSDTIPISPGWEGTLFNAAVYEAAGKMLVPDVTINPTRRNAWNGEAGWPFGRDSGRMIFTSLWHPLGALRQIEAFFHAEVFAPPNPAPGHPAGNFIFAAQGGVEQDDGSIDSGSYVVLDPDAWVTIPIAATHMRVQAEAASTVRGQGLANYFAHWRELA